MEEVAHVIDILTKAKRALETDDAFTLREISDQTIHAASVYQHTDYILVAVTMYALSKFIERKQKLHISNWKEVIENLDEQISLAIQALEYNKQKKFIRYMQKVERIMQLESKEMHELIKEVLRKSAINKASKIYEHGLSLAKTAKMLGVSQWELSEYVGEKENRLGFMNQTIDVKVRAKIAMDFFT